MTGHSGRFRRLVPVAVLLAGAVLAVVTLSGVLPGRGDTAPAAASAVPQAGRQGLNAVIHATQDKLRRLPDDAATWARLGAAYVEQARITADPSFYAKAQGALEKSLRVMPIDNAPAMIGMGQLANARHDFASGQRWGEHAKALSPWTAEVSQLNLVRGLTSTGCVKPSSSSHASVRGIGRPSAVASAWKRSFSISASATPTSLSSSA